MKKGVILKNYSALHYLLLKIKKGGIAATLSWPLLVFPKGRNNNHLPLNKKGGIAATLSLTYYVSLVGLFYQLSQLAPAVLNHFHYIYTRAELATQLDSSTRCQVVVKFVGSAVHIHYPNLDWGSQVIAI